MPETPPAGTAKDPVVSQSLSLLLLVSSLLLLITLLWSLYDEAYSQRPWKSYQDRFVKQYIAFLRKTIPEQAEREKQIRELAEFQRLTADLEAAESAVASEVAEVDREINQVLNQLEKRGANTAADQPMVRAVQEGNPAIPRFLPSTAWLRTPIF